MARLFGYLATSALVLVLRKRHGHRQDALQRLGGLLVPIAATLLSLGLLASAGVAKLVASALALLIGALIYRFWRRPINPADASRTP